MSLTDQVQSRKNAKIEEVEARVKEELRRAKAQADQEALIEVVSRKVKENPELTFGEILEEMKSSKKLRATFAGVRISDFVKAASTTRILAREESPRQVERDNVKTEIEKLMNCFRKQPLKQWTVRELAMQTSIARSALPARIQNLMENKFIARDDRGVYSLRLTEAREYILNFLRLHGKSHIHTIVGAAPEELALLIEPTLQALAHIGTIVSFQTDYFVEHPRLAERRTAGQKIIEAASA